MTTREFNEKYKKYLGDGHYGLDINDERVINYLDKRFEEFSKIDGFKYFQIKIKFGYARFYGFGISNDQAHEVEEMINSLLK